MTNWIVNRFLRVFASLNIRVPQAGKAVLITGCDSGFGLALAKYLNGNGCCVFAGCLLKEKKGDGARELAALKRPNLHVLQLDVADDKQVSNCLQEIEAISNDTKNELWGIVNNAGIGTFGEVEWVPVEVYQRLMDINVWGTIRVTKASLPLIRKSQGRVVNIGSMLGRMGYPLRSPYCITKFAVEAFSDSLRYEMKPWKVGVSVIEPGNYIAGTSIFSPESVKSAADVMWKQMPERVRQDYSRKYFDGRVEMMMKYITGGDTNVQPVLDAVEDALFSKRPRPRYVPASFYYASRVFWATHLPESKYGLWERCERFIRGNSFRGRMGRVRNFARALCVLNAIASCVLIVYCALQSSLSYYGARLRSSIGLETPVAVDPNDFIHIVASTENLPLTTPLSQQLREEPTIGSVIPNCGVKQVCPEGYKGIRVSTHGKQKGKLSVCLAGVTHLEDGVNGAGRGINVVVTDASLRVTAVRNFDTYESVAASAELEKFLKLVADGSLAIFITFDEPSRHLTRAAQTAIADNFGSSQIHNLGFRSHWYLIGRKGMDGISPYEKIGVGDGKNWGGPLDERFCLSHDSRCIPGLPISADPVLHEQRLLNEFCAKHSGYESLCNVTIRRDPLLSLPLKPPKRGEVAAFKALRASPALSCPIVVIARGDGVKLADTLKTLVFQIGLRSENVIVLVPRKEKQPFTEIAGIFGFLAVPGMAAELWEAYEEAFEVAWNLHPEAEVGVFLEEGSLLSPAFLSFMIENAEVLLRDDSLLAVSSFNPIGFEGLAGDGNASYRVETFPGLGFMLKREIYMGEMKGKMHICCRKRPEEGWLGDERIDREVLIPADSRILVTPTTTSERDTKFYSVPRSVHLLANEPNLKKSVNLTRLAYEKEMKQRVESASIRIHVASAADLNQVRSFASTQHTKNTVKHETTVPTVVVISFAQTGSHDFSLLTAVCSVFGLVDSAFLQALHRGALRFSFGSSYEVFILGTASDYYKYLGLKT
ncbi:unnamed protein product [Notodromas monacha]|uniref:ILEI/PANDER domain-containing protein n=1 Tax=Notodromas monacha TaxID=399045 RepID=A0A7R9G8C0_9CRUS|nr:unnamed protein product [Notodromas monacha]CAG0913119.1 unnamed protein product [Notodromas monacha]